MNRVRAVGGILLWLLTLSCGRTNFKPESLIDKVRVIGMQFEPPEIFVGEESLLTLKLLNPQKKSLQYSYKVVSRTGAASLGNGEIKVGDKKHQATFTAPFQLTPQETMRSINVEAVIKVAGEELKFRKLINIWARGAIKKKGLNQNPQITSITFEKGRKTAQPSNIFGDDRSDEQKIKVKAQIKDPQQNPKDMMYRWYATGGRFTSYSIRETEWFCEESSSEPVMLYAIVRDLKGGLAWWEGKIFCKD